MEGIAKDCYELIRKKMLHEIGPEQYYLGLMELHKKYPLNCDPNFYDAAQIYIEPHRKKEREDRLPYKEDLEEEVPF